MLYFIKICLSFFSSLLVTLLVLPIFSKIASRINLMDYPDKRRKVHIIPKPLIGGLGMLFSLSFCFLLFIPLSNMRGFYIGIIILGIVGFLDDFKELSHKWKFLLQILASIFMIYYSNIILHTFGNIVGLGPTNFGVFSIPLTIFCTVGVINATNMIDGLDGLAGGISLIAFISFAILSYMNQQTELMLLSLALSGAVIGFLMFNWYPSTLFLGDTGSLFLGFSLAFLSIAITQSDNSHVPPIVPLIILTVPIGDTLTIMIKRALNGKNPFHADKYHLHHILLRLGFDKKVTVKIILFFSVALSSFAVIGTLFKIQEYLMFSVFLIVFSVYFVASLYIKEMVKFKGIIKRVKKLNKASEATPPTERAI